MQKLLHVLKQLSQPTPCLFWLMLGAPGALLRRGLVFPDSTRRACGILNKSAEARARPIVTRGKVAPCATSTFLTQHPAGLADLGGARGAAKRAFSADFPEGSTLPVFQGPACGKWNTAVTVSQIHPEFGWLESKCAKYSGTAKVRNALAESPAKVTVESQIAVQRPSAAG